MNDKNIIQMPDGSEEHPPCSSLFCYRVYSRYGDAQLH